MKLPPKMIPTTTTKIKRSGKSFLAQLKLSEQNINTSSTKKKYPTENNLVLRFQRISFIQEDKKSRGEGCEFEIIWPSNH